MVLTVWETTNSGSFQVDGIVDVYESIIWNDRYFEAGDFELYLPASDEAVDLLQEDRFITSNKSEHVMIIEHVELNEDFENGDKIIVKGRSAESILDRRIIKTPIDYVGATFPTVMYALIAQNIWAQMDDLKREIPQLNGSIIYEPSLNSMTVSCYLYGASIYEKVVEICKELGIGYRITMVDIATMPKLQITFYYGLDLTDNPERNPNEKIVIFSDSFDNLAGSNYYLDKANYKNFVYIDGKYNEEIKKETATLPSGAPSGLARRETYLDASSVPDKQEYNYSINVISGSFTVSVDNLDNLLYKTGYSLDQSLNFSYHSLWYYPSFSPGNAISLADFGLSISGTPSNNDSFSIIITKSSSGTEQGLIPESTFLNRLVNEGKGTLIENDYIEEFDGSIIPGMQWKYGKGEYDDYYLGDIVTIRSQYGVVAYCRITEFVYSESADEISELPTFEIVDTNI